MVKFGSWRRARLTRFSVVMLVLNLVAFVLGIVFALRFGTVPGWAHTASYSLIFLASFSLAATFLGASCLYLYGALIALSPLVGEWFYVHLNVPHHGYPVTFGLSAAVPICVGLVKLIRLLRAHPTPSREPYAEEMPGA